MKELSAAVDLPNPADFFTSGINLRLPVAIALMVALYMLSYLFWAFIWLLVYW